MRLKQTAFAHIHAIMISGCLQVCSVLVAGKSILAFVCRRREYGGGNIGRVNTNIHFIYPRSHTRCVFVRRIRNVYLHFQRIFSFIPLDRNWNLGISDNTLSAKSYISRDALCDDFDFLVSGYVFFTWICFYLLERLCGKAANI